MMNDLKVQINKTISAPIERVFDAWLDPVMLSRFILPMPGMPEPETENDAVVGGKFTIIMHVGDDKVPHSGEYLEIEKPSKLVFSWKSPYSTDDSTVTLNFKAVDENSTIVELTHLRFLHEEARDDHEGGWKNILDKLDDVVGKMVAAV